MIFLLLNFTGNPSGESGDADAISDGAQFDDIVEITKEDEATIRKM